MEQAVTTRESDSVVCDRVTSFLEQNGFEVNTWHEGLDIKKPGISKDVPRGFVQWWKDRVWPGIPGDSPRRSILVCKLSAICPHNGVFGDFYMRTKLSRYNGWNMEVYGRNNLESMQAIAEEFSKLFAKKIVVTLATEEQIRTKFSWESENVDTRICDM